MLQAYLIMIFLNKWGNWDRERWSNLLELIWIQFKFVERIFICNPLLILSWYLEKSYFLKILLGVTGFLNPDPGTSGDLLFPSKCVAALVVQKGKTMSEGDISVWLGVQLLNLRCEDHGSLWYRILKLYKRGELDWSTWLVFCSHRFVMSILPTLMRRGDRYNVKWGWRKNKLSKWSPSQANFQQDDAFIFFLPSDKYP